MEDKRIIEVPSIIFDNHLHLRRDGHYLQAVHEFKQMGGTHFNLCQYPMPDLVRTHRSYKPAYQQTIDMAIEIRKQIEVTVYVTLGPYPVDYLRFVEWFDCETAMDLMRQGINEAAALCKSNNTVVAIGEIGRPHFPVDSKVLKDSNKLLIYGMKKAQEINVPVVLHTEGTTPKQCEEMVNMGRSVGLPPDQIVKHFSPPLITKKENHGLIPSVLASRNNIETALIKGNRFLMETDYIDDISRPGAVLGPKTVPKITKQCFKRGLLTKKAWQQIHIELPEQVYGIQLI